MRKKLTDLAVARMRPPERGRVDIWDTVLPAFGIRISNRRRTWMVALRRPGKKHPVRQKLGTAPMMSLADARAAARAMMETGAPPAPVEIKVLAEEFLEHGRTRKGRPWSPATMRAYRSVLFGPVAPLHHRHVLDIRRRDIADLLRMATERGATMAALTRATMGRFWSWLLEIDRVDYNPVVGTPIYEIGKRSRVISDAELRAIWAATEERSDYNTILRLCLWTGCRRSEAGGVRWSELVDGTWTIPAARTKNSRELVLPLPRQARAALDDWPRFVGRDHLFGRSQSGFVGWSHAKAQLDARLRFNQSWDIHDCRRTVETRMAKLKISKDVANRVLNHAVGPITEAYDHHDYIDEKRAALQAWADEIERVTVSACVALGG